MSEVLDRPKIVAATRKTPAPAPAPAPVDTHMSVAELDRLALVLEQVSSIASLLLLTPWTEDAGIHGSIGFIRSAMEEVEETYGLEGAPSDLAYSAIQHGLALSNLLNAHLDDGALVDPTGHERELHPLVLAIQHCSLRARTAMTEGVRA